jgi:hypothetical protein
MFREWHHREDHRLRILNILRRVPMGLLVQEVIDVLIQAEFIRPFTPQDAGFSSPRLAANHQGRLALVKNKPG